MDIKNPILKKVYALDGDAQKTRQAYADWAASYDQDTLEGMGYVAPVLSAEALAQRVAANAEVLDAGCGTGLAGEELKKHGVEIVDGIDLSREMLDVAGEKSIYRNLAEADMTQPLDIPDNAYDGVLSVGVFTSGHVGPEAIGELARITRPGAPMVITVHEHVWDKHAYGDRIAGLEDSGVLSIEEIVTAPYHEKEGYTCKLCVLRAA